jgi:protein TonB
LVWLKSRHQYDFYKADGSIAVPGQTTALPAPLPPDLATDKDTATASGLTLPSGNTAATPPPPAPVAPRPVAAPPAPAPTPEPRSQASTDAAPEHSPAPRYPQEAMRRGIGGTARVRVDVSVDGDVDATELAESSGDRTLDRAALDAVRRWRFHPATRNGQPVASQAIVPIVFNPAG